MSENQLNSKKKGKQKRWVIPKEILDEIDKNPNFKSNSSDIINRKNNEILDLVNETRKLFEKGDFINSAKLFRLLAKETREIQYKCEKKGEYDERNSLNNLTGKEWLRHTKSWLIVDGKPSDIPKEIKNHPASYPPALARHFIEFFSKEGDWVFDPFLGIGSTLVACRDLDRNCFGIELNPEYASYAQKRSVDNQKTLDSFFNKEESKTQYIVINDDCRNTVKIWKEMKLPKMKCVVTSPPYWNMLGTSRGGVKSALKQRVEQGFDEKYSDDEKDFGNIDDYDKYLNNLSEIFSNISQIVEKEGYFIIILQNIRDKEGNMRPVAWDFAKILGKNLSLKQEFIWCQDQKFMGIWGYPTTYISNVHHHYCLVFQNL
ncbi:MAG: site-specific DNA-methyltransferase [Candidatus Lokiarchaeota archaeon]|nr:site-specific DNA-methyltransferase [Candidatus Harpocratesius repetitus]